MPRLLACYDCGTISKLPDYTGPVDWDMALIEVTKMHQHNEIPDRQRKGGNLFTCDEKTAEHLDPEQAIKNKLAETHVWMHDTRDELKDEAMKCFNRHGRPGLDNAKGCSDLETPAKIIGRKTGVPKANLMYLCHFCPFEHGVVIPEIRRRKGMYGK